MINAIQIAVTGLNAAAGKAETAATGIARASLADTGANSLIEDIVDLKSAATLYKADLKTIQAVSDMQQDLLKIFDRKV